ncbi:glycosyltransferase family 2 protein [Leifsonia shinshuensis]|uniref:glycosyltransferase family 2 protein n=1 Tax=Leifsonia shinshuensis TaxID=150026 RepID=UPI001F507E68|nr:glycosyltransferase family 2 protein [Leifsonia shinshuensis]MCI0159087.1 glycosyltransferase family 2 protein [Leifsonia shinshuensis]
MSHPDSEYPISIVVCFHNAGGTVEHALERLDRLGRGAELVLVDDASRDDTLQRLRTWSAGNPHATVVALDENHGPALARNVALRHVRRDYVWFVDDDDEPAADALEIFDRLIRASRPHLVFARARFRSADGAERWVDGVDESGVIDREQALLRVLGGDVQGFLWSKLFHRSVLADAPFGTEYPQEDFVGVIGAVERSERVVLSPNSVYTYVERPGSLSRGRRPDFGRYAVARDVAVAAAARAGVDPRAVAYFRLWFYAIAVAFVPIRRRAPRPDVREGLRLARTELRTLNLGDCAAIDRRAALHGRIIAASGRLYPLLLTPALWLHDRLRRFRS